MSTRRELYEPNKIHPESRREAVAALRDLADRLEEGGDPVVVLAWDEPDRPGQLRLVGSDLPMQAYMLGKMQALLYAEMTAMQVMGAVQRWVDHEPEEEVSP